MIEMFLSNLLLDPDTIEFGRYFQEHYTKNIKSWAYCHHIHAGINTNMHIENMHRSIKYIYLNGKINKRLDKAIHILMKFVRDKLFNRLLVLNKDSAIKWNMCKHIHLLCTFLKNENGLSNDSLPSSYLDNQPCFNS